MTDSIGELRQVLADRYEIHDVAGRGGMATVYRATDLKHGRSVALKVLEPELARAVGAERFLREIQIAAQLQHPAILSLFDSGEADGYLYYVMPFVEGPTLADVMQEEGALPLPRALAIAGDIAAALDYAHEHGVVHRDVKPGNILLVEDRAQLADFGLATAVESAGDDQRLTETGTILGTPTYMSPEQATGQDNLDRRSDLYSFGCVVYEMLAGQPPFDGRSAQAVLARHVSDQVPPVSTVRPQLPAGVDDVLVKALAKAPADRYESSTQLVAALSDPSSSAARSPRKTSIAATIFGVVGIGLLVWKLATLDGGPDLQARRTVRVTFDAGPEYSGTLSPDSRSLVYSHTRHGTMDIFLRPREGGEALRLTDGLGDEILPRWSPGGTDIAYVSERGESYSVFRIGPTGGEPRFVVDTHIPILEAYWDAQNSFGSRPWSQDGESLLYSRALRDGGLAVYAVDLGTREERQLTSPTDGAKDLSASWSFDGHSIVFSRAKKGVSEIWLVSPDGGDERVLLAEERVTFEEPGFLPDGRHVVLRSNRTGTHNIWALDVSSGALTQMTFGGGKDQYPNAASDGVVTMTQFSHQTDLYELTIATGEARRLTEWTQDNFVGRYAPDGKRLAYHSTRTGNAEIMVLDLESGSEVNLSDDPSMDVLPDWSPDGKEIVFVSNRTGATNLWIADVESGRLHQLSEREIVIPSEVWGVSLSIRWTPDGGAIGFVEPGRDGSTLWVIDRAGGEPRAVRDGVLRFDWYRDRDHIVYTTRGRSAMELRAADLETGEEALLFAGPHTEMVLRRDGSAAALLSAISHFDQHVHILPLEPGDDGLPRPAGELQRLTEGGGRWHVHNGGFSPDGERLAYTRDEDDADIFLLVPEEGPEGE